MTLLASLLVNAIVAATPSTPLPWYGLDDYPVKAFERQWSGAATFELLIDPEGRPANCTIVHSSGHSELDRQTCFIAMHRARFTPARGPDGTRVYASYRSMVKWRRPDQESLQGEPGPDLEVTVAALPAGTKEPLAVKLAYFVDAQGKASSCAALPESNGQPSALVEAACRQMMARDRQTTGGRAAVKTAAVLFTTKP